MTAPDRTTYDDSVLERFWSRVQKSDGCWLWTGARSHGRYGKIWVNGQISDAHRVAWTMSTGQALTRGDRICHTCDVEHCVRNDDEGVYVVNGIEYRRMGHLFLATAAANTADMVTKRRHGRLTQPVRTPRGERMNRGHLTEADICAIRRQFDADPMSVPLLALAFRTSKTNIRRIGRRETWRHV